MESKKVKEIKKVLESFAEADKQMTLWQNPIPNGEKHCIEIKYADILTYINELESENESCHEVLADLKAIIKQQNDRIAELEKENGKQLKQFAERVKMEFYYEFDELIPSIMSDKIDKILKELKGE